MSDRTPPPPPGQPAPSSSWGGSAWFGLIAVIALAVAMTVEEDGDNGWGRYAVWAGFAIAAAAATLAPAVRRTLSMQAETAWQVAVAGGIGLAGFWVLFVLPAIEQNVSFLATLGVAAGVYAAWTAPGRPHSNAQAF